YTEIILGCIILGEKNAFSDFNTGKTIGYLKIVIKEQAGLDSPAYKLKLWKVNIPESEKHKIYEGIDVKVKFGDSASGQYNDSINKSARAEAKRLIILEFTLNGRQQSIKIIRDKLRLLRLAFYDLKSIITSALRFLKILRLFKISIVIAGSKYLVGHFRLVTRLVKEIIDAENLQESKYAVLEIAVNKTVQLVKNGMTCHLEKLATEAYEKEDLRNTVFDFVNEIYGNQSHLPEWTKEAIINIKSYGNLQMFFQHDETLKDDVDVINKFLSTSTLLEYVFVPGQYMRPDGTDIDNDKKSTDWGLMYHQKDGKVKCTSLKKKFDGVINNFNHCDSLRIHYILPDVTQERTSKQSNRGGCYTENNDIIMYIDEKLLERYFLTEYASSLREILTHN
ncbi:15283_t:CDS:2, partial [Funneliformis caledonium]